MSVVRHPVAIASLLLLTMLAFALSLMPGPASAAPFTVTRTDDGAVGSCDADCSLREAIIAANALAGADDISLPAGTYTLALNGTDEDDGQTGDLDITEDLTITGAGAASTIIQACDSSGGPCVGIDRVLHVLSGTLILDGVTVQNGFHDVFPGAGGIYVASNAAVTLLDSAVSANSAGGATGGGLYLEKDTVGALNNTTVNGNRANAAGGIYNEGMLTLTDSTVSDNFATEAGGGAGGGIFNPGAAVLTNSTVSGNQAAFNGGGIVNFEVNFQLGTLIATNSTFSGNTNADFGAGAIYVQSGTVTLNNSTIAANESGNGSGGVTQVGGTVNLKNTILTGNTSSGADDCSGTLTSQGYNLIENISGCTIGGDNTGNITGQDADLAPLALNAPGTTETHALLDSSPAIDAGSPDCPPPAEDQRGAARSQGDACDIGAYESPFTAPTPSPSPSPSPTPDTTPTPEPTSSPTPTETATGVPTGTPTPSPAGTPTPAPDGFLWGDVDCSDSINPVDSLKLLRFDAGLSVAQAEDCPPVGEPYNLNGSQELWGDVDCSQSVNPVDSLKVLRFDAGLAVNQEPDCPQIGTE